MEIRFDDLSGHQIQALVMEHLKDMSQNSSPESCHALNTDQLRSTNMTLWSAWEGDVLVGCGALKEIDPQQGEVKTMRTIATHRNKGVVTKVLAVILEEAKRRNYKCLSLETGSGEQWAPARHLYRKFGFQQCRPFADYVEDPESFFMTLEL